MHMVRRLHCFFEHSHLDRIACLWVRLSPWFQISPIIYHPARRH